MNKLISISILMLRILFLGIAAYYFLAEDWVNLFVVVQAILVSLIPNILFHYWEVRTAASLRLGIVVFMFLTLILGELAGLYNTVWWWDILLHLISGVGITIIGFMSLQVFISRMGMRSNIFFTSLLAVSMSFAAAVSWEFFEFFFDFFADNDRPMQASNTDTMIDLMAATIGSLVVGIFGHRYLKRKGGGPVDQILKEGEVNNNTTA